MKIKNNLNLNRIFIGSIPWFSLVFNPIIFLKLISWFGLQWYGKWNTISNTFLLSNVVKWRVETNCWTSSSLCLTSFRHFLADPWVSAIFSLSFHHFLADLWISFLISLLFFLFVNSIFFFFICLIFLVNGCVGLFNNGSGSFFFFLLIKIYIFFCINIRIWYVKILSFYIRSVSNTWNYFSKYFHKYNQTLKKQTFFIC